MSVNTPTGALAAETAHDEAVVTRRKAAEKCQLILETLYDSYDGYKQCAADTKDTAMKLLFDSIAASRNTLIAQLATTIRENFGVEPYVIQFFFYDLL